MDACPIAWTGGYIVSSSDDLDLELSMDDEESDLVVRSTYKR